MNFIDTVSEISIPDPGIPGRTGGTGATGMRGFQGSPGVPGPAGPPGRPGEVNEDQLRRLMGKYGSTRILAMKA